MILTGLARLGRDAEVRYTNQGKAVCSLSLAFNYGQKDAGNKRPSQWVDASLWEKRAEALAPYLKRGGLVAVVLSDPHLETFEGKNGQSVKLVARVVDIELAGGGERDSNTPASAPRQAQPAAPNSSGGGNGSISDLESDIPF